jgi:hypothetical protein
MKTLILLQVFSCFFMTGIIWLVQILVYPNFRLYQDPDTFIHLHHFHTTRITWIVAPAMTTELLSGVWLFWAQPCASYFCNCISICMLWVFTAVVNVPIHRHLEKNPHALKNALVLSNWPRTIVWSARSAFWFWLLLEPQWGNFS